MPGKIDWLARGLPRDGENASERRAFDLVVDDVATCGLHQRVGEVRERVAVSRYGFAFVVSETRVLLGRLRRAALEGDPALTAEAVMELVLPSDGDRRSRREARGVDPAIRG
jgi:hypothetical protein